MITGMSPAELADLRERFRVRLVLAHLCLKLGMMIKEDLHENCSSYFVGGLHRSPP